MAVGREICKLIVSGISHSTIKSDKGDQKKEVTQKVLTIITMYHSCQRLNIQWNLDVCKKTT